LRKQERTRAHVFVAMLALKVLRHFRRKLQSAELTWTAQDALDALSRYVFLSYDAKGTKVQVLPQPDNIQAQIFEALGIKLPQASQIFSEPKNKNVGRRKNKAS